MEGCPSHQQQGELRQTRVRNPLLLLLSPLLLSLLLSPDIRPAEAASYFRPPDWNTVRSRPHRRSSNGDASWHSLPAKRVRARDAAANDVTFTKAQYQDALNQTFLFLEAQRSGHLPKDQRVTWRADSALTDGQWNNASLDLVGGYYDAGDNVKFGFPMAYTITMLSWVTIQYERQLKQTSQYQWALEAIKWGTDYLIKAHTAPDQLYVMVAKPTDDHNCWMRPETMQTPRQTYYVGGKQCGSDVAAETAAAMSAASIVYQSVDSKYSATLLTHAEQLFSWATSCLGKYSDVISDVNPFYSSYSGYHDELLWGATWLFKATNNDAYFNYIVSNDTVYRWSQNSVTESSWDDKSAGSQLLLTQLYLQGNYPSGSGNTALLKQFKTLAEIFACNQIPPYNKVTISPGGHIYIRGVNNQYVTNVAYMLNALADYYLDAQLPGITCSSSPVSTSTMTDFSNQQIDYILGANPLKLSFMVGFGPAYVMKPHHRGSSLPSIYQLPGIMSCNDGFNKGLYNTGPNTQTLHGAIVGGPDQNDQYTDDRTNYNVNEPTTYMVVGAIGSLARLVVGYLPPGPPSPPPPPSPPSPPSPPPSPPSPPPPPSPPSPPPSPPSPPPPPPFAGKYVTVSCSIANSWSADGVTQTAQFSCNAANVGPYTLSNVVLGQSGFTASGSGSVWNIIPNADGTLSFPSYESWPPGQVNSFGFIQNIPPNPVFTVISYDGAPPTPTASSSPPPLLPSPPLASPAPRASPPPLASSPPESSPSPPAPPTLLSVNVSSQVVFVTCKTHFHELTIVNNGKVPITNITLVATNFFPTWTWGLISVAGQNTSLPTFTIQPVFLPLASGANVSDIGFSLNKNHHKSRPIVSAEVS